MDGVLIVNKPQGWTSHDVVSRVRRIARKSPLGTWGHLIPWPPASCRWFWASSRAWRSSIAMLISVIPG